ncbi:phenylalanine 4-monooxygenase [Glaciecola sp. XM2]|jgi:phenylalanine-4-hydroxylase|uniref:phenylalanine 4-monooxygenase n=1 Tax=Glaciecola sp. XM2 TaxID=1914931 RepID=UPI001BDF1A9F|nr:phenylalanine 4-monooxygenase [Glaciecola sp. XM2]MBT1450875.1 phenylalanine 4-monooxygenase [Glaciecola sp. XM2]
MSKSTKYVSREISKDGMIAWSSEENDRWARLYDRQMKLLNGRACDEYMQGIELLKMPADRIPQLPDIDKVLNETTGWTTAAVPALINFTEFFTLLANKRFPVATFMRSEEEFDYLQEPDVFHEIFGHCPLLTNPAFAHFTHTYGKLGLAANKEDRAFLARLYWFTVEFGLVQTEEGLRIYGGGILSSPGETLFSLENEKPERNPLVPIDVLRTPYRIDIMQPIYYVLENFNQLFELAEMDIMALVEEAKAQGLFEPKFPPKLKQAS